MQDPPLDHTQRDSQTTGHITHRPHRQKQEAAQAKATGGLFRSKETISLKFILTVQKTTATVHRYLPVARQWGCRRSEAGGSWQWQAAVKSTVKEIISSGNGHQAICGRCVQIWKRWLSSPAHRLWCCHLLSSALPPVRLCHSALVSFGAFITVHTAACFFSN